MKSLQFGLVACALGTSLAFADPPGAQPGDEAMTCEQIGMELAPYAQAMTPNVAALNDTNQELLRRGKRRLAEEAPVVTAETEAAAAASASGVPGAGAAATAAAEAHREAMYQKDKAEDAPLAAKQKEQATAVAEQAQAMQANARIMRLMQLAQDKHCD
jgi:hypothetical protein